MTTLSDRYVWGVLRAVPESQRADLEPEIRALVADAVDARIAAGATGASDAERAALVELGDPEVLASRYTDRTLALIGPRVFLDWKRVLTTLVPIVVPIVTTVVIAADLLGGAAIAEAVVAGLWTALMVGIQLTFWITVAFAAIDRSGTAVAGVADAEWSPDDLPAVPASERIGLAEMVATVIANGLVAAILIGQQISPAVTVDGAAVPLFDPALWSFWLPWFVGVALLEIVLAILLYVRGRWTWAFAIANAALGAAFAIPAVWLLQNGLLLNPVIVDEIVAAGGRWLEVTTAIAAVVIVVIVGWDAIDGFRKAWINARFERVPAGAA